MTALLIGLGVVVLVVAVVLASQRSGPRITTIEHRRDTADKDEDSDDA